MESSSLQTGTIIKSPTQEYKIERILGAGGFGITYLATSSVKYGNVYFNVKFAIKEHFMEACFRDSNGISVLCTPSSKLNVAQSRKDFLTEAKRLQKLCQHSRSIVKVNEAFEANGTAYYVMEYLDGGNPGKMSEEEAIDTIRQIAEAVKILHKNKLLHLDIKPDNIVLKKTDDGSSYPVLIDFGLTKHFDDKGNPTSTPNAKGISLGYAPIEQNDIIKEFSPTLDIYALGATLFYFLTGKNPPSSVKLIDPAQKELNKLIPPSVSQSTRNAILNAMKPNKNDRTQTVDLFLKDLQGTNFTNPHNQTYTTYNTNRAYENSRNDTQKINKEGSKSNTNDTEPISKKKSRPAETEPISKKRSDPTESFQKKKNIWLLIGIILVCGVGLAFLRESDNNGGSLTEMDTHTYDNENSQGDVVRIYNINGHDGVDMGLSVLWATNNLGAEGFGGSPEQLGDFYAYGELSPADPQKTYNLEGITTMNKSNDWLIQHGITNKFNILNPQYDAVTSHWGKEWRIPTKKEFQELLKNSKIEFAEYNGQTGVWLTGPSGASIFMPLQELAGDQGLGNYMTSEAYDDDSHYYGFGFPTKSGWRWFKTKRNDALLIRPVSVR